MSTQDATEIPLSSAFPAQAFKLLELPPELLALLESDDPPTLHLKSSVPQAAGSPSRAILSTPSKTYRIQQKNSSNPIMLLEPSEFLRQPIADDAEQQGGGGGGGGGDVIVPALRSIATIEDTLELVEDSAVVGAEEEQERLPAKKVGKWHEKFAKGRK